MAVRDSMILELLDPEAARRLSQKERLNQQLAMAQSRNPLLAEAQRTAGMLSQSLGSALGRDMRSPEEKRAVNIQAALRKTNGNIVEAANLLRDSDPAGAMLLARQGAAMRELQPKLTQREVPMGYRTITVRNEFGLPESKTVQDKKLGAFDEQGNLVGFYEEGGLRRISPQEAEQIQANQEASAQSTGVMKGDVEPIRMGSGNVFIKTEMGQGVRDSDVRMNVDPDTAEKIERSQRGFPPRGSRVPAPHEEAQQRDMPIVEERQGITPPPAVRGTPVQQPEARPTVQTAQERNQSIQAIQQQDTPVLQSRLQALASQPTMTADQQEEYRRIIAELADRAPRSR